MELEKKGEKEEEEEELPCSSIVLNRIKKEDDQDELDTTPTYDIENHIDTKEEILFPMHFAAIKTESQSMEDEVNEKSYGYNNDFNTKNEIEYSMDMSMTFKTELQKSVFEMDVQSTSKAFTEASTPKSSFKEVQFETRISGKPFLMGKNKKMAGKIPMMKQDKCRCRYQCKEVEDSYKIKLFTDFHNEDQNTQCTYLLNLIEIIPVQRRRNGSYQSPSESRRQSTVEKEDIGDEIKQDENCEKQNIAKETRICSKSNSDSFEISCNDASLRDFQSSCVIKKQLHRKFIMNEHFIKCTICSRTCPNKNKLDVHMRMHTGERPYTCTTCNKSYRQKSHLNHHLESHAESQRYNCVICNKLFFQKCNLNRHMILHSKEKDFHCDQCDKKFFKKVSLKNHIAIHSNDRQYICDICNKSFIWKSNLNNHKRIHSEKKPFNCDVCKKSFSHKSNFNKHMTVHNESRPFACKVCIKSFCRKDSLKKHMLKHSGERPFRCHVCNKTFAQKCILNIHIRRHLRDTT